MILLRFRVVRGPLSNEVKIPASSISWTDFSAFVFVYTIFEFLCSQVLLVCMCCITVSRIKVCSFVLFLQEFIVMGARTWFWCNFKVLHHYLFAAAMSNVMNGSWFCLTRCTRQGVKVWLVFFRRINSLKVVCAHFAFLSCGLIYKIFFCNS